MLLKLYMKPGFLSQNITKIDVPPFLAVQHKEVFCKAEEMIQWRHMVASFKMASSDRLLPGTHTFEESPPTLYQDWSLSECGKSHFQSYKTVQFPRCSLLSLTLLSFSLGEASDHVMRTLLKPIEKSMWWETKASHQEPCEWAILDVVPPAPRDCSLIHERPWARTIQLSHFWIPGDVLE